MAQNLLTSHRGSVRLVAAILAVAALFVLASASPALAPAPSAQPRLSVAASAVPSAAAVPLATPSPDPVTLAYPDWINVTNPAANASPPAEFGGSMAVDPADNITLYFGGCGDAACPDNQTWAFADGRWANLTDPHHAPPARVYASMDYDPNMGGVLLFGGGGSAGFLDDTWLFRHGVWTNLSWVGPSPAPREAATMAFDPQPEENGSVLFGGVVSGVGYANDTWIWEGWSGWVPLSTSVAPPPTGYGGMAFDAADGAIVLYRPDLSNQTWELYSGQWWAMNPAGFTPPEEYYASMVYDPSESTVVLFGGFSLFGILNVTFAYAGDYWGFFFPAAAPPPLLAAPMALDPSGSVPILFGGLNSTMIFGSTWVFEVPPTASLAASAASVETSAPVTFTATVGGGTPPYTATFDFGDNTTATVTGIGPTLAALHAYGAAGSYVPSVAVEDSVGASVRAGSPGVAVTAGPSVRASASPSMTDVGSAMAFSAALVSPGTPPVTYTWHLGDGTTVTGQNVSHAYGMPGTYAVEVTATDSAGGTSNATVTVQVNALPTVSIVAMNASTTAGTPVAFFAPVVGGTGPFQYHWSFGDGSTSSFAAPVHTYNATGTYTVVVWANDTYGGGSHATVTVVAASVSALGSVPLWFWAGLAALIALGVVAVVLLVILPRRGRPPKTSSEP